MLQVWHTKHIWTTVCSVGIYLNSYKCSMVWSCSFWQTKTGGPQPLLWLHSHPLWHGTKNSGVMLICSILTILCTFTKLPKAFWHMIQSRIHIVGKAVGNRFSASYLNNFFFFLWGGGGVVVVHNQVVLFFCFFLGGGN